MTVIELKALYRGRMRIISTPWKGIGGACESYYTTKYGHTGGRLGATIAGLPGGIIYFNNIIFRVSE
jgi:hypothetical protein